MDAMNHNMEILDQQTLPGQACWVSRKETPYRVRQALYPAAGRPAHRCWRRLVELPGSACSWGEGIVLGSIPGSLNVIESLYRNEKRLSTEKL